uniref:Protein SKT5 n=1 Tax=Anthurium amnicola TaxID=1678845 RepID=A0A1D1Y527_9ARAE
MLILWRSTIALFAISLTSVIFTVLVKISIYDIGFADNLPVKGVQNIPQADNIIPNIFVQIPRSSSLPAIPTTQMLPTQNKTSSNVGSPEQCFYYAKNCRDIQCAFKEFNVNCNSNQNGPVCTCGTSQTSNASSIQSNAHLIFSSIFIFVISFYYYI